MSVSFDVVIPTLGRSCLTDLLKHLREAQGPRSGRILLVDDRRVRCLPLPGQASDWTPLPVQVVSGRGAGPASARNIGWRLSNAEWVAFLDDDVLPAGDWWQRLEEDLSTLPDDVAGSQGRVRVPMPAGRKPTDWERNVGGLETARWITADMAYRRSALARVGGFDERFRRAYREDADLALRIQEEGFHLVQGSRTVLHPPRPAGFWVSLRLQRGNADDALMAALHGRGWQQRANAPVGRIFEHGLTVSAATLGLAALAARRRRIALWAALSWLGATGAFAWSRIAPGPRTLSEIARMSLTSAFIPFVACYHRLRGWIRWRRAGRRPRAVVFDRDGTLVVDVPYNGDPERVVPMPAALRALERLRAAGIATAVISNQSGVARGRLSMEQVRAVNERIEELLGPLGPWFVCPHGPHEGCSCRKPAPGLLLQAARSLGVEPWECVVVGDIGADVEAAEAAGARAILVPTPRTRVAEVLRAREVAPDLEAAVDRLLAS